MTRVHPRFFGVMDEDPFQYQTWSGLSKYFFGSLDDRGCLAGATGTEHNPVEDALLKLRNFHPDYSSWRFKYHLDPQGFALRTKKARKALYECKRDVDCIIQVGAWYDMTGEGLPVVSYHDGNLARRLDTPYGYPNISRHIIQRALSYERHLYDKIDIIFSMSKWLASSFINDFGVSEEKVVPVYAGVNLPDKELLIPAAYESRHIVFVGKDFRRKGGPDLLTAFSLLRKNLPDARLTLVGPEEKIDLPGVKNMGPLSKATPEGLATLESVYKSAALFVLPTLYEPFGVAFAEAMSHGLPCIGTKICAVPEIIAEGESGLLVSPRNPEELAKLAFELLRDPKACERMGAEGFRRYRQLFRWDIVAEKICRFTREAVVSG